MSGDVVVSAASPARKIPKGLLAICYLLFATYYLLLPGLNYDFQCRPT